MLLGFAYRVEVVTPYAPQALFVPELISLLLNFLEEDKASLIAAL
jgi:hypothetical protein